MTAYLIALVEVTDANAYQEYTKRSPAAIDKYGGRFIARGGRSVTLEGDEAPGRLVVVEFPNVERVVEFYNSPEYQDAMTYRAGAANARILAVEGV